MNKKIINKSSEDIFLFLFIFIAVFCASITNAKIRGVSLGKIGIIPLYVFLIFKTYKNDYKINSNSKFLIFFYLSASLSCLISLFAPYASNYSNYFKNSIMYLIQLVFIYVPLLILFSSYNKKDKIINYFKKSIIYTARINIIWAIFQFIFYAFFTVDINKMYLGFLYEFSETYSSTYINFPSIGIFIRVTGFNTDAAFFGLLIILDFIFEKSVFLKLLCFVMACFSMSRTAMFTIIFLFIFDFVCNKKFYKPIKNHFVLFFLILLLIPILLANKTIGKQFEAMFSRIFGLIGIDVTENVGDGRHIMYIFKAIEIVLKKYNPIQFLFGYGPRQSGTILANYHVMDDFLDDYMINNVWTIECDWSELLLGYGIVGTILYILSFINLGKVKKNNAIFLCLFVFVYGFMYDISANTLLNLILIVFSTCNSTKLKAKNNLKSCNNI